VQRAQKVEERHLGQNFVRPPHSKLDEYGRHGRSC
jgi:hypothetical protein